MLKDSIQIICWSFSLFASSALANGVLDFAYGDYQSAPYVYQSKKLGGTSGIMLDISKALSQRIPFSIKHVNLPRKRTEQFLHDGKVDIRCHLSPNWVENAQQYIWTEPLYSLNTVIITHSSYKQQIQDIDPLKGMVLGTVHGYRYSKEIQELLKFLETMQLETPSLEHALQMLSKGRVNAVIGNHILANYLIAQLELQDALKVHPYVVRTQDIHCALSRRSDINLKTVIDALHKMKNEGVFEVIFNHYFEPIDVAALQ